MLKALVLLMAAGLAGCASARQPEPESLTPAQWCKRGFEVLGYRTIDPAQKAALLEMMRNRGCLGKQAKPLADDEAA